MPKPSRAKSIEENYDDLEELKRITPGASKTHIDFIGALVLAAAIDAAGIFNSILVAIGQHAYKGPAVAYHVLSLLLVIMAFVFFFWRVFTNNPEAGKRVFLWTMLPFCLAFIAIIIWTTVLSALE